MVQPENINSGHSNSELGVRCGRHHHHLAHLRGEIISLSRLEISHRLFAARCIAAIVDRGWLLPGGYRPKPRLSVWCLRVAHDAANYWSAPVTEPHIVSPSHNPAACKKAAPRHGNCSYFDRWRAALRG